MEGEKWIELRNDRLKEIYGIIIEGVKYINRKGGKKGANHDDF